MKISDRPYNGIYNTDESKVPPCEIPSPLKTADGGTIRNAFEWMNFRRPELLNLFRDEMYGWMPPRPVYVASAADDLHSDPKGEYLSAAAAAEVYRLFGAECRGLDPGRLPPSDVSIGGEIGYHIRTGSHDVTPLDWKFYMDFADRYFLKQ